MRIIRLIPLLLANLAMYGCGNSGPESTSSAGVTSVRQNPAPDCQLVMGWDPWEPYQYQVSDEHVVGLDVDLLTAVLENAGCDISFRRGSWTDLLSLLKAGEIDLLAGATQTESRNQFAYFTDEYRDEEFYMYVKSGRLDEFRDKTLDQLITTGTRFGVIEGYLYSEAVSAFQNDSGTADQFSYSSMSETNMAKLLDGDVDAVMEDKYVGAAIIRRKNLGDQISPYVESCGRTPVRIMLSKASVDEELFAQINQSLMDLTSSGEIQEVLDHYLGQ